MKIELPVILTLAATMAYSGGHSNTSCGPGGCWMMPVDYDEVAEILRESAAKRVEIHNAENTHSVVQISDVRSLNSPNLHRR